MVVVPIDQRDLHIVAFGQLARAREPGKAATHDDDVCFRCAGIHCPSASNPNRVSGPRLKELGDEPGPPGLVRSSDATTRVAVEVLVEVEVVAKLLILLQLRIERVDLTNASGILQEN